MEGSDFLLYFYVSVLLFYFIITVLSKREDFAFESIKMPESVVK